MLIVVGVLMLIGLVILHELGHFYAARKSGIDVEEFGIGFPPKAKSLGKKNGTEYTLNWLPLGGFVKLKGEHDADTAKGSFGAASLADKVKVMIAGVVVNLFVAIALIAVVAMFGLPKVLDNQFTIESDQKIAQQDIIASYVAEVSPAESAGLVAGDTILSVTEVGECGQNCKSYEITQADNLSIATKELSGKMVQVSYKNQGSSEVKTSEIVQLQTDSEIEKSRQVTEDCISSGKNVEECPEIKGFLGVVPSDYVEYKYTWSAPIVATVFSAQLVQETFVNLGTLLGDLFKGDTQSASQQVTGVVGIGYVLGQLSAQGFISVLFLIAVISLSLAIMNILPIPALDGGRLFVTLLFKAINKPLTKDLEEKIHGTGFAALMILFLLITVVDVQRFIL